jgi:hypothetical protein
MNPAGLDGRCGWIARSGNFSTFTRATMVPKVIVEGKAGFQHAFQRG